jgi:hypothetical protein
MESVLYFFGAAILAGAVLAFLVAIVKQLWLTFKWRVLGWKPSILDEKLVTETVEYCTSKVMESAMREAKEQGCSPTLTQIENHRAEVKNLARDIIEIYIDRFTRK